MDPATIIATAFAAIQGAQKLLASLDAKDLTPEQLAQKKALEDASRKAFDEYVASLGN